MDDMVDIIKQIIVLDVKTSEKNRKEYFGRS